MKVIFKRFKSILTAFVVAFMGLLCAVAPATYNASAEEEKDNSVLVDLQKDPNFKETDYPSIEGDYSLDIIQIAENTEGELYIYVYQPSHNTKDLKATKISMSTAYGDSLSYKIYDLEQVSTVGTLDKYRVLGFEVLEDMLRYYDISEIYRAFDGSIDEAPDTNTGNSTTQKAYAVAKRWTACTVDGKVSYTCKATEVVIITDKVVGYIQYSEGFKLYVDRCNSHFVAFSCDHEIDKLMEADVYYVATPYSYVYGVIGSSGETFGEPEEKYAYLKADQVASNDGDGLGGKTYTWKRIESVKDVIANEGEDLNLTEADLEDLEGKEWILRFTETDYRSSMSATGVTTGSGTKISDVTILRLKFETDGVVYNLGVVDDMTTGGYFTSADTYVDDFTEWIEETFNNAFAWWQWLIIALVAIAVIVLVVVFIKPITSLIVWICKGIWWLICAPFRFIRWIIRKIRGDYD